MLKAFVLMIATMLAVFSLPVLADDYQGLSPAADHSVPVGEVKPTVDLAIAECDRCMYAGLGDKQPLIAEIKPSLIVGGGTTNAWIGYFEVGWRS